jgi:ABC-type Na+ efflux pump permease subunit
VAYPVAGYVFQILDEKYRFYEFSRKGLIYIASALFVLVLITFQWGFSISIDFYEYHHHSLLYFIWVITLVCFWIILIRLLVQNREQNPVGRYLQWVGRSITNFYVFQWLLIGNIGTALYKTQSATAIFFWFALILLLTSLLVYLWRKVKATKGVWSPV